MLNLNAIRTAIFISFFTLAVFVFSFVFQSCGDIEGVYLLDAAGGEMYVEGQ